MKTHHLFSLLILFICPFSQGQETARPKVFSDINEIIPGWTRQQHVWMAGKLPVASKNLSALEKWIADNAPNWTVVLMKNARGQSFEHYRGMDAVEHALGKGLSNQTNFGNQLHPKTRESDGAIFVLFLEERKFSYFASDAYDNRDLGDSHWIGRLDREAIRAMRNGGRISDTVKNTITSIDRKLNKAIQYEVEAKKRAVVAQKRRIEEAQKLPELINQKIAAVTTRTASHRSRNSDFAGPLAFPPEGEWRSDVKAVQLHLANQDFSTAQKSADVTLKKISQFEDSLKQWENSDERIGRLGNRLKQISFNAEAPRVEGLISRAKASIQSATNNHRFGDPIYIDQIAQADESIAQAQNEIGAYEYSQQVARQRARAELQRQKVRKIRNTGLGGGVGAALLAWLAVLNRKRRKSKDQALKLYQEWRLKLRGKFDRLFNLMDRTSVIQRNSDKFEGQSDTLTKSTVREVDELFIMSSATDRVMENVDDLIAPDSPWRKLANKFSSNRYRQGIAIMDSKPIGFDKSQGLKAILRSGKQNETRSLLGKEKDYQPFSMSFKQLMGEYDAKELRATGQLERLEHSIDGLPLAMGKASQAMEQIEQRTANLNEASQKDHFFPLTHLQDELLPSIDKHLDEATELGANDPVSGLEGPGTLATRQIADASNLLGVVESTRSVAFSFLHQAADRLESFQLSTDWIDEAIIGHSQQIEHLSNIAMERSIADEIDSLHDDLTRTRGRIQSAVNLAERIESETKLQIKGKVESIDKTRQELAAKLNLKIDDILHEEDLNPSDRIKQSEEATIRIRHSLSQGNLQTAQEDFRVINQQLAEVDDLLHVSNDVADNGMAKAEELTEELDELRNELPEARALLKEMSTAYPSEILLFKERFGGNISGQKGIERSIEIAEQHVEDADQWLSSSHQHYRGGALIAAGGHLEKAANETGFASHQVALIKDHHTELKKAERDNKKKYEEVLFQYRTTISKLDDPRTTEATIERQKKFGVELQQLASQLSAPLKNPFRNGRYLKQAHLDMAELEDAIKMDWEWHAQASDEVAGARKVLQSTERLINLAQNDGLTDSRKLGDAIRQHFKLDRQLLEWSVFLKSSHQDWEKTYREAVDIEAAASQTKGIIEQEIQAANAAANELQNAASAISDLRNWRDAYRIQVDRAAGDSLFNEARTALENGDYRAAISSAAASRQNAGSALLQAKSAARRARAAEEAERRRRAAAAAAASRRRSSSSWSSSSSSRGSSISRSSSSRSSSRSSGSGFSRSGW